MDVTGMAEGDRVVGVRVAHGWDADTSTPLVLLQLRTDAGDVGLVSMRAVVGFVTTLVVAATVSVGAVHADEPPGASVSNFGQCNKIGLVQGAHVRNTGA